MVMVTLIVSIYYNVIIAYSLYYLFASFQFPLPWSGNTTTGDFYISNCFGNNRTCWITPFDEITLFYVFRFGNTYLLHLYYFSSVLQCEQSFSGQVDSGQHHLSSIQCDSGSRPQSERAVLGVRNTRAEEYKKSHTAQTAVCLFQLCGSAEVQWIGWNRTSGLAPGPLSPAELHTCRCISHQRHQVIRQSKSIICRKSFSTGQWIFQTWLKVLAAWTVPTTNWNSWMCQ